LVKTLPRWYWTVRALMNSRAPISGFDSPSRAALQGAIFAVVKAAVDRGAAEGTRRITGVWPGDQNKSSGEGA
jgi:hypothetical protein